MKLNKLIIKTDVCMEQIKVLREIKSLKKHIKECKKRLVYLDILMDMSREKKDWGNLDELSDSWYDCHHELKASKKALKELKDKYYFFL